MMIQKGQVAFVSKLIRSIQTGVEIGSPGLITIKWQHWTVHQSKKRNCKKSGNVFANCAKATTVSLRGVLHDARTNK